MVEHNQARDRRDERITVAIGVPMVPGDPTKTIILGVPQGAWDSMRATRGGTQTVDLSSLGMAINIILFAGADGADIRAQMEQAAGVFNDSSRDETGQVRDLGIKPPTRQ